MMFKILYTVAMLIVVHLKNCTKKWYTDIKHR